MIKGNQEIVDRLSPHLPKANELFLDWDDGGDFPANIKFWNELYDICKEKGYRNLLFCCLGGHGRTGTALLAFLISNSVHSFNISEHSVDKLKAVYCPNTVETLIQENYLERLDKEKEKSTDLTHNHIAVWGYKNPKIRKIAYKTTSWQNNVANSQTASPSTGVGAKTLTEVIRDAQAAQDRKQKDIFEGQGDDSAMELNQAEQQAAANKSIVIDLLSKEERQALEATVESETIKALRELDEELSKPLKKCFCTDKYTCMACERLVQEHLDS